MKVEFTVVDRGTGELEVIPHYENNANTFTNTALGDLSVEKVVKGNGGNVEKEFTFTITLEGVDGVYATTDETGAAGSITFTSGTAETRLSHGEKLVIHGIPAGTSYTVEEEPDGEYSTSSTGDSGVIAAGLNESVFTNTKTIELPTGVTVPLAGVAALAAFGAAGLALTASKRKKEEEK